MSCGQVHFFVKVNNYFSIYAAQIPQKVVKVSNMPKNVENKINIVKENETKETKYYPIYNLHNLHLYK